MKSTVKKILLLITVLCTLGSVKSMATCFNYKNNLSCKLELQIFYGEDCDPTDGIIDANSSFNLFSTTLPANSTTSVCPPQFTASGCPVIITGYFIKNTATGEVVSIAEHDPNGVSAYSLQFLPSFQFKDGDCKDPIYIEEDPEGGTVTFQSTTNCPQFCFENKTGGCYLEITVCIEDGDLSCTPENDFLPKTCVTEYLGSGNGDSKCFDIIPDRRKPNCTICPGRVSINICGEGQPSDNPRYCFAVTPNSGGQGTIKCNNVLVQVYVTFVNGVYVISR